MHDVGMNMSQLAMSVKQVDDTIELAHEWSHQLLLDNSAADVMRETYADMLVAIDDFDTAMLKPGLVAHVQGRRVLALDGFEAALTDKAAKQRMWAYIKQLTPASAPL